MVIYRMNDYFVKFLFGSDQNKKLCLNFINAALGNEKYYFTDIAFVNKEMSKEAIMKRLVLFFLTMVMCCAFTATALAAPSFYASPNYDLSGLSTIKLTDIDEDIPENKRAVVMPEEKLLGALYKSAQKLRLEFVDARDRDVEVAAKNVGNRIRVGYLEVVINDMSSVKRLVPGRWETRTEYEDRIWYDRDGRKHIDRVPYRRDVWIPETWHIDMRIALLYTLYDENKNVVAKCSDARVRNDEDSPNGMLSRSTADFFKLLIKTGRK